LDATVHSFLASLDAVTRRPDLHHFHAIGPGSFASIPRLCRQRAILTVHSLDWQRAKWRPAAKALMRLGEAVALRSAHRIIAVSPELEQYIRETHGREAVVIPNGVSPMTSASASQSFIQSLGLAPNRYILFMGRFVPEKRLEWLIESFRDLDHEVQEDWRLVLAGGADSEDFYGRDLARRAEGLPCLFPGFVKGEAKKELLRSAGLVVLPSSLEGQPIFLLEAMSSRRLCLASDIPPNHRLLEGGRGLLFDAERRDDLTRKLERALRMSPEEKEVFVEPALRYVEEHHNWDKITDATEKVYRDLVGR
jgi:glycosyltransferase involved in cell wall biosynthesis